MEWSEFVDWIAFYHIHPFGEENLHAARALAMFYNANRGENKPEAGAEEFMIGATDKQQPIGAQVLAAFKHIDGEGKSDAHNLAGR